MVDSYAAAYILGAVVGFVSGAGLVAWYFTVPHTRTRGPFEAPAPRRRWDGWD